MEEGWNEHHASCCRLPTWIILLRLPSHVYLYLQKETAHLDTETSNDKKPTAFSPLFRPRRYER